MTPVATAHQAVLALDINELSGALETRLTFSPFLNILSGENGTGKTRLLEAIRVAATGRRVGNIDLAVPDKAVRVTPVSPLRSIHKANSEASYQAIRSSGSEEQILRILRQGTVTDASVLALRPFGHYLAASAEKLTETQRGTDKETAAAQVQAEYGKITHKLLGYELSYSWDYDTQSPSIALIGANGRSLLPEQFSTGEAALLSLGSALYFQRNDTDIYLIDEPEIHMHWKFERQLFEYLSWLSESGGKQIVVATHSRAVFSDPFIACTQFLAWDANRVVVTPRPTDEIRDAIAGDLVRIAGGLTVEGRLYYVEDDCHSQVVREVASRLGLEIAVSKLGNSPAVRKLAEMYQLIDAKEVRFLVDNDNESPANEPENLIRLSKYEIENYLMDVECLQTMHPEIDPESMLKTIVSQGGDQQRAVLRKLLELNPDLDTNVFLELLDRSKGKPILVALMRELGYPKGAKGFDDYLVKYLDAAAELERLEEIFADLNLSPVA